MVLLKTQAPIVIRPRKKEKTKRKEIKREQELVT